MSVPPLTLCPVAGGSRAACRHAYGAQTSGKGRIRPPAAIAHAARNRGVEEERSLSAPAAPTASGIPPPRAGEGSQAVASAWRWDQEGADLVGGKERGSA